MFVYIWKDPDGVPFYVGLTKDRHRTNPRNSGGRNWLTKKKLGEIGAHRVIVEIRPVESIVAAQELERKLIDEYGRIQMNAGPLTNLRAGGEGTEGMSAEKRKKLSDAMRDPNHPIRSPEARERQRKRMQAPDIKVLFSGENNPAKKQEVRDKLKARWQDPEYRERQRLARTGKKRSLSAETKTKLAANLKNNPHMKSWAERNGKDQSFEQKRIAALRAAKAK